MKIAETRKELHKDTEMIDKEKADKDSKEKEQEQFKDSKEKEQANMHKQHTFLVPANPEAAGPESAGPAEMPSSSGQAPGFDVGTMDRAQDCHGERSTASGRFRDKYHRCQREAS